MRLSTISIIMITVIIYIGKIENAKVPIAIDPVKAIEEEVELNEELPLPEPMKAIKEGVALNEELMKTLKDVVESSTIMSKINAEIHKLKLVNDYLEQEEIRMVTDAKVQLALAENELTTLRIELTQMAEYTKATTTRLIKFTKRLSKDSSQEFNKQFEVIFKRFITLMKVTSKKLATAKKRYDNMTANLATTKAKLEDFKGRVEDLDDEHSKRYIDHAHKLRVDAYGGSAACLALAPTCPFVYAVVVPIIEGRLQEYKDQVEELKRTAKEVSESATGMLEQITAKDKELKKELSLLNEWELSIIAAEGNYGTSPITETIQDIATMKDFAIEDFQTLYDNADAFNKAILKAN